MIARDDIIRMAREAGFADGVVDIVGFEGFANFAALVAAHERGECAKVCDEAEIRFEELCDKFAYPHDQGMADASHQLAAAIRARGEK
jgi:hypothetical protein